MRPTGNDLFKVKTWEELKMVAEKSEYLKDDIATLQAEVNRYKKLLKR